MSNRYSKDNPTPELLWQQFIDGDMVSFRKIYIDNYQNLYNYGIQYLSSNEVEDCIQNLFLKLLQKRKSYKVVKNVNSYLFISFRNQIIRSKQKKKIVFQELVNDVRADSISTIKDNIFTEVTSLLKKLSPREYEVIQLKYFNNLKSKEIAETLNIENQTVRNTITNAFKKLRKYSYPQ